MSAVTTNTENTKPTRDDTIIMASPLGTIPAQSESVKDRELNDFRSPPLEGGNGTGDSRPGNDVSVAVVCQRRAVPV